jgi:aminopeptidase-like protein
VTALPLNQSPGAGLGDEMYRLIERLYPICRSITGNGLRQTLGIIGESIPIKQHELPTGAQAFDWVIPKEWNIRDAFIKNSRGERIVDFKQSNLHVVNYSVPVRCRMPLPELKKRLFTIPEHPEWIPYRTSYYKEDWGFCITHSQLLELRDDDYDVCIDSSLAEGHLTYGELLIPGESSEEVLISAHVCHPSLCNDNLSGIAVAVFLAKYLMSVGPKFSHRFLFIPGTIGAIAWLSRNESNVSRIRNGLVLSCLGDGGKLNYKKTRRGNAEIDRAVGHVFRTESAEYGIAEFSPYGYDERQFCSPGFNLPVGSISRTPHAQFPEYHTSADNLDYVNASSLADSYGKCMSICSVLENNTRYMNLNPKCEPQLGKRGLFRTFGGRAETRDLEMAMFWVLNLSDGENDLLTIAEKSKLRFQLINEAAGLLQQHGLLGEVSRQ